MISEFVCGLFQVADESSTGSRVIVRRSREQRMLARVDGTGIVRAGEYALTRLAATVIEYFLADEALTRESLTLLTGTLRAQLAEALAAAKKAGDEDAWHHNVIGPLRVTVGDLVAGIERRQRGLDAQQEEVQADKSSGRHGATFESSDERCCGRELAGIPDRQGWSISHPRSVNAVISRRTHRQVDPAIKDNEGPEGEGTLRVPAQVLSIVVKEGTGYLHAADVSTAIERGAMRFAFADARAAAGGSVGANIAQVGERSCIAW